MKIAYVYDAVYPWVKGGAEHRIYELSRRLALRGHEVHCFGAKWWDGESTIVEDDVHIHGISRPMSLYSGDRRSMREALYFASKVLTSLRGEFDLIDCQEFPYLPCFPAKLLSTFSGSDLFITWHEVWGEYWYEYLGRKGFFGKQAEKWVSKLTDRNIAVSERTQRDLKSLGASDVMVVPNGIDLSKIERVPFWKEESDVVYAGRLAKHKNVDLLIKALSLVKREIPDVRAVIIGDGPEAAGLKSLARDLYLEDQIEFTGFLDYHEMISRMKSSKAFVMPSTREGFGMVALEANACGLPVITVRHDMNAVCDLVKESTGFLCDLSEEGLAGSMLQAISNGREMRESCISQARRYGWDEICLSLEQLYES